MGAQAIPQGLVVVDHPPRVIAPAMAAFWQRLADFHSMKPILALMLSAVCAHAAEPRPNILLIYADDIGYGDLGCYGAEKVKTPNCDKLAAAGIRFTDGHSVASVCTPSRYALLTGDYAFRKKGTGIASGVEGLLIGTDRTTLPSMLKGAGYTTGVIGKWHLGLGTTPTDYNQPIKPGPREIGFDYSWLLPATGDRVPCVWVENDRVVNLDPADPIRLDPRVNRGDPKSVFMGIPRLGSQTGGTAALWKDDGISHVIANRSRDFIEKNKAGPFFLFMSTHNIHVPRVPNPMFLGKSNCGVRGDAIVEFDWMVGRVLDQLDTSGLAENTLVILTSDNGGINDNNGPDAKHGIGDPDATNGHRPNGALRGTKSTVWEGGTRVPFIVRWPAKVKPGVSDALMSQLDLLASLAALTGQKIPAGQARDSENHLAALLGNDAKGREFLIEQSNGGAPFGFRNGSWKLLPNGGGRQKADGPALYNLAGDLGESDNIAGTHPERVAAMMAKLASIAGTQSTPASPDRKRKKAR
jgi:arylsulfatase A-like enzyme